MDLRKLLTAIAIMLPWASHCCAQAEQGNQPVLQRYSDELLKQDGVWRSRGYGWWWVIKDGRVTIYDAGAGYCSRRWQRWGLPRHAGSGMLMSANGRTIRLTLGDRTYFHTFDKVSSLPRACRDKSELGPRPNFEAMAAILSEHYAFFEQRGVDWSKHLQARRLRIHDHLTEHDLFWELAALIKPIDDSHVGLEGHVAGRQRQYDPPRKTRKLSSEARHRFRSIGYWTRDIGPELIGENIVSIGDGRIKYGLIGPDVAYLYVSSTGRSLRRALNGQMGEVRKHFRGARALIIDLSKNFGGSDYVGRRLASKFMKKRTLAYYKYAGDDPSAKPQPIYIEPSKKVLFDGPIYVVTSASTISAAEILVMSLRALPNVTHIGSATRGSLSDILTKRLPNGWILNLSNEVYLDHEKTAWEGLGIKPHIEFAVKRRMSNEAQDAAAARRVLDYVLRLPVRRRAFAKPRS
ncbi:MAG: S41 family peptidase [Pseudomonadota bacterium]